MLPGNHKAATNSGANYLLLLPQQLALKLGTPVKFSRCIGGQPQLLQTYFTILPHAACTIEYLRCMGATLALMPAVHAHAGLDYSLEQGL